MQGQQKEHLEGYCVPDQNCYQGFTFTSKTECDNNYGHLFVIDGSQTSYFRQEAIWIRELIRLLIRNIGDINGLVIQEQQELITSIISILFSANIGNSSRSGSVYVGILTLLTDTLTDCAFALVVRNKIRKDCLSGISGISMD